MKDDDYLELTKRLREMRTKTINAKINIKENPALADFLMSELLDQIFDVEDKLQSCA